MHTKTEREGAAEFHADSSMSHTCHHSGSLLLLNTKGLARWAGSNFEKYVYNQQSGMFCFSAVFRRVRH